MKKRVIELEGYGYYSGKYKYQDVITNSGGYSVKILECGDKSNARKYSHLGAVFAILWIKKTGIGKLYKPRVIKLSF